MGVLLLRHQQIVEAVDLRPGEFLRLAERADQPDLAMRGHWAMEITFTHRGDFGPALQHFEKALALYDPEEPGDDAVVDTLDPGVAMRCFAAWSAWSAGQHDRGLTLIQDAVARARELQGLTGWRMRSTAPQSFMTLCRDGLKAVPYRMAVPYPSCCAGTP